MAINSDVMQHPSAKNRNDQVRSQWSSSFDVELARSSYPAPLRKQAKGLDLAQQIEGAFGIW